jgi:steroid delta-isomerase-like uncharacterized protein
MNAPTDTIVTQFYEAYNRGDVDGAVALYAPGGKHVEVAQGREANGRDEIASGLRGFLASFPDARWNVQRTIVEGQFSAVTYLLTGTLQEQLGPFEAAGQTLELRGVHVFEINEGAVALTEDYWDSGTFGRQMRVG